MATAAIILPWPLLAGVCAQRVVTKQRVVYAQPVYQAVAYQQVYSPYQYAIGSDLVLEALAEKLAARLEQRLQAQQRVAQPLSIVAEKCARCHSPQSRTVAESDAPVFFDQGGVLAATAEQRASMRTAARLGAMPPPPGKELTDDEYIELRRELERGAGPITDPLPPAAPQSAPLRAEPGPIPNGERRIAPPAENLPPPPPEKETQ